MYIWNLAIRKGKVGYCKYAVKSSVRNAPIFGWAFWVFEFLMLDRKWEVDSPVIESYLQSFKDPADPIWLVIFPEGTDFT
jgi:lysocardiolipin and lysophospholipid acyltransferase